MKISLEKVARHPLTLVILGAVIPLYFAIWTNKVTARETVEANLINEFVKNTMSNDQINRNLQFLIKTGLVPDYKTDLTSYLKTTPDNQLPSFCVLGVSKFDECVLK